MLLRHTSKSRQFVCAAALVIKTSATVSRTLPLIRYKPLLGHNVALNQQQ